MLAQAAQGLVCAILILAGSACTLPSLPVSDKKTDVAVDSIVAVSSLLLAVTGAELLNMTEWQRVWSARDQSSLRIGLGIASVLVFFTVTFLGLIGYATDSPSFLDFVKSQGRGASIVTVILIIVLCTSTVDALQQGIVALVSKQLEGFSRRYTICAFTLVNVISTVAACFWEKSIMELFLTADLVASCVALPVFMGISKRVTNTGAIAGSTAALATVFIFGVIADQSVIGGLGRFAVPGGLYARETLYLFASLIGSSAIVTAAVSKFSS